jgi:hypothetical protein
MRLSRGHWLYPVLILLLSTQLMAQESHYQLFRHAISQLQEEHDTHRKEYVEQYELQLQNAERHGIPLPGLLQIEHPALTLRAEREAGIEKSEWEFIDISISEDEVKDEYFFTSEKMFPGESAGMLLLSNKKGSWLQDRPDWFPDKTITYIDTVRTTYMKDSELKAKWTDIIEFENTVNALNAGTIIAILNYEAAMPRSFFELQDYLEQNDHSLVTTLLGAHGSNTEEKIERMKAGILEYVDNILRKG